jgi:hypothetical protein
MEIEIENWRPGIQYDSDKSLATFDVRVGESLYLDLRLMKAVLTEIKTRLREPI